MLKLINSLFFLCLLTNLHLPQVSIAQEPLADSLVCLGLNKIDPSNPWRMVGAVESTTWHESCPKNHVFMATHPVRGLARPVRKIRIIGNCCPVPKDLLLDSHTFELESCPDNYVATGIKQEKGSVPADPDSRSIYDQLNWVNVRDHYMRCTRINTKLYKLGPKSVGYKVGQARMYRDIGVSQVSRAHIPATFRSGFGRNAETKWVGGICVGYPWGSVLVGKGSKYCSGFYFREIIALEQKRNPIFPQCHYLKDQWSRDATCVVVKKK